MWAADGWNIHMLIHVRMSYSGVIVNWLNTFFLILLLPKPAGTFSKLAGCLTSDGRFKTLTRNASLFSYSTDAHGFAGSSSYTDKATHNLLSPSLCVLL